MGRSAPLLVLVSLGCGEPPPSPPAQPVPFSHRVHAGVNQIGCTMCHAYAQHAPVAGMPSMQRCTGCHKFIGRDKPAIELMNKMIEDQKPIAWSRVYRLPDHVYFTHQGHVAAGMHCEECHGDVQSMEFMRQVPSLTMGWCIACHEQRRAALDCLTCHK
jgi:hypothetical protein